MTATHALLVAGLVVTSGCRTVPGQDVRYEPTPMPVVRAMLELADVGPDDVVFDLGSGDGRIPIMAAREFGARAVGVEVVPALVVRAEAGARDAGVSDRVEFRLGNMHAADLRAATVVTLFLHPQPNLDLRPRLLAELPPGARVVSYIWDMGDWVPDEVRAVNRRKIFLWRIPPRKLARRTMPPGMELDGALRRHVAVAPATRHAPDSTRTNAQHRGTRQAVRGTRQAVPARSTQQIARSTVARAIVSVTEVLLP